MTILHTISGMGVKGGGTSSCTYELVKGIQDRGIQVEILSFEVNKNDQFIGSDIEIHTIPLPINTRFLYSKSYKNFLIKTSYQLLHTNGLWQYPEYITSKIARKKCIPYVISPHGMLYPQALKKSAWQKLIMLLCHLKKDLNHAAAVHATCLEEMQHLRNLGIKSPVAVIPNPVNISPYDTHEFPLEKEKMCMGYLGRIHPRKNIERLFYAWEKLGNNVAHGELLIIGDGDRDYMQFLKDEVKRLQLTNVVFTGFLAGVEKDKALDTLSYLAVPSDFENFGMIVPEVLIKGIPVIASKGTPWEELNTHQCGWWVDNDVDTLTATIQTAIQTPETERTRMGENGKRLVRENYSVEVVSQKMKQLYEWILSGGEKPEFVYL